MTKSDGGQYQCDCTAMGPNGLICSCSVWFVIPKGRTVPSEARCPECSRGCHK